jgi:SAM-dependent methyltransferase
MHILNFLKSEFFKHNNCGWHNVLMYWSYWKLLDAYMHPGHSLVDLGCGNSPYKMFFADRFEKVLTVDWSASPHDTDPDLIADLNKPLPIADCSSDCVISLSVLEHLTKPNNCVAEANRILKPGGKFIVQVPFMWWVHEAPHDYQRWTEFGLLQLLEGNGFKIQHIIPQSGVFLTVSLKLNYVLKRFIRKNSVLRYPVAFILSPIMFSIQLLGYIFDKIFFVKQETFGYFIVAEA